MAQMAAELNAEVTTRLGGIWTGRVWVRVRVRIRSRSGVRVMVAVTVTVTIMVTIGLDQGLG